MLGWKSWTDDFTHGWFLFFGGGLVFAAMTEVRAMLLEEEKERKPRQ